MKKGKVLTIALSWFMVVLMGVALISLALLPWIVARYMDYAYALTGTESIRRFFLAILYISGLLALLVLYELRSIFRTCVNETPFISRNVLSLKRIAFASLIIGGLFAIKVFFIMTFLTFVVIFVFALAAAFCLVLAEVFQEAVNHKNEIDLTI